MQDEKSKREAVAIVEVGFHTFMLPVRGLVSDIAQLVAGAQRVDEKWIGVTPLIVQREESLTSFDLISFKVIRREVITQEEFDKRKEEHDALVERENEEERLRDKELELGDLDAGPPMDLRSHPSTDDIEHTEDPDDGGHTS